MVFGLTRDKKNCRIRNGQTNAFVYAKNFLPNFQKEGAGVKGVSNDVKKLQVKWGIPNNYIFQISDEVLRKDTKSFHNAKELQIFRKICNKNITLWEKVRYII